MMVKSNSFKSLIIDCTLLVVVTLLLVFFLKSVQGAPAPYPKRVSTHTTNGVRHGWYRHPPWLLYFGPRGVYNASTVGEDDSWYGTWERRGDCIHVSEVRVKTGNKSPWQTHIDTLTWVD